MELQLEHHLDPIKSLIYPANASMKNIKRIATIALMVEQGSDSPFFNAFFPSDVRKPDADQKAFYCNDPDKGPKDAIFKTDIKYTDWVPLKKPFIDEDISAVLDKECYPSLMTLFDMQFKGTSRNFHYAMYEGSLTVPPCFEDVYWIVVLNTAKIRREQLLYIDRLFDIKPSRVLQKNNDRTIAYGEYKYSDIHDAIGNNIINK